MINVYINGVNCPIVNDDTIVITKKIIDIENPEQKQIDYSKGFLIQNTAAVNTLFNSIFDVNKEIQNTSSTNFNTDFNPNLKAKCVIMNDNAVVMSGYCQMIDITILDDNKIAYNINCYGSIGNFFNDIKNLKLSDIDFTDLNHSWTLTSVTDGWTPILGFGYCYPMIDYGMVQKYDTWNTQQFRPAVFVKDIVDRIFAAAGWNYSSAFFTSDLFKHLIVPCSEEKLLNSNATILLRNFQSGNSGSASYGSGNYNNNNAQAHLILDEVTGTVDSYPLFNDSFGAFNTGTYEWTCTQKGWYKFGVDAKINMTYNIPGTWYPKYSKFKLFLLIDRSGGATRQIIDYWTPICTYPSPIISYPVTTVGYEYIKETSNSYHVGIGDKVYLISGDYETISTLGPGYVSKVDGDMDSTFSYLVLSGIAQPEMTYGDTVVIGDTIPTDIKQSDFISSLSKMFNLYFEQINDKTLLIEPREDYFTSDIVDWTTKIDIGQQVKLTPMGMNQQKRYLFNYDSDSDYLNNRYFTAYKEVYGTWFEDITTDFLTETKEIKPIFAATPLSTNNSDDKILSSMKFIDENGVGKEGKTKIRILYWGGLTDCKSWTMYEYAPTTNPTIYNQYPYAGHLDNPKSPTIDLNFGSPIALYYTDTLSSSGLPTYKDNSLYTLYWKQTVKELTNKNSKVLEAMFYLTVADFITLDFRKQYFIKDAYYRLIEIVDYDINGTKLVKCKLLKVDREPPYVSSSKVVRGGKGIFDSGRAIPINFNPVTDGNIVKIDKGWTGTDNYNQGTNTLLHGSSNIIPSSATDVFILGGNSNVISSDRVMVFNSDSVTMNKAGAMFNNCLAEYKTEFTVDAAFLKAIDGGVGISVLPELASNEYYEITRFACELMNTGTAYTWTGTGDITLKTDTSATLMATIPGASWLLLTTGIGLGTVTGGYNLYRNVNMAIAGTWFSGNTDIRIIIYYKIIII